MAVTSSSVRRLEGEGRLQEMAQLSASATAPAAWSTPRELLDVAGPDGLTDRPPAGGRTRARPDQPTAGGGRA